MKNKFFLSIFIIILLSIIIFAAQILFPKNKVCFDKNCFNIEVVSNQEELSKGLMFRSSLDKNSGMLFVFPEEELHSFWMKNTLIPLDIIWINTDREIVFIKHNAPVCLEDHCESFTPNEKALYVLEINSGIAEEIGLKEGDGVEFEID